MLRRKEKFQFREQKNVKMIESDFPVKLEMLDEMELKWNAKNSSSFQQKVL